MTRPPTRPLRALLALTALLTTVLTALGATAAAAPAAAPAAQQQTFGIQPASAGAPDQRAAFTYAATPGAQLKDHIAVFNYGDEPLTLTLYAADAFNTSTGGYDVLPAGRTSVDIGSWVHLATGTVVLPPRTRQIVPFTLAVPATAGPGDHSGGIVLALRRHSVDAKGNAVAVDQRVGTRIHLRVPGALRPRLVVESVSVHYRGTLNPFGTGSTTVSYTVRNAGNIRLGGQQAVRVRDALGLVATARGTAALTELLPGNTETYTVRVPGVFPTLWSTASITVDPLAVPGDADPALPSAVSNRDYATVPWTLIALLLPVLALIARALLRLRRRRRGGPSGSGTPGVPAPPTAPARPTSPAPPIEPTAPTGLPAPNAPQAPVPAVPGAGPGKALRSLAVLGLALGTALTAALGGPAAAFADGTSPSPTAVAGGAAGVLFFGYPNGHDDDPINVATSGRCPEPGQWLSASVSGPGLPAGGVSDLGVSAASIYPAASTGGYTVPLVQTLRAVARQNGVVSLHGRYRVDVYCRPRFGTTHLRDFVGTLTFATPGAWTADRTVPVTMPQSSEPPPTTAASAKAPLPAARPRPGGTPVASWLAMAAGAALLTGLGVAALRRRRAQVVRAKAATAAAARRKDTAVPAKAVQR
ncbi:hypothetical protein [Streptacidiphilus rugosus]|uniref:hypothetical protein n=1 Tax=Streptacidiphilus rugosus TaxID=405783 RepID=UPI0007C783A6|nr:hypothetical protein [Streptacidiphilus rugosus]